MYCHITECINTVAVPGSVTTCRSTHSSADARVDRRPGRSRAIVQRPPQPIEARELIRPHVRHQCRGARRRSSRRSDGCRSLAVRRSASRRRSRRAPCTSPAPNCSADSGGPHVVAPPSQKYESMRRFSPGAAPDLEQPDRASRSPGPSRREPERERRAAADLVRLRIARRVRRARPPAVPRTALAAASYAPSTSPSGCSCVGHAAASCGRSPGPARRAARRPSTAAATPR